MSNTARAKFLAAAKSPCFPRPEDAERVARHELGDAAFRIFPFKDGWSFEALTPAELAKLSAPSDPVKLRAAHVLVGATVESIRRMTADEMTEQYWDGPAPLVIEFDDGRYVFENTHS